MSDDIYIIIIIILLIILLRSQIKIIIDSVQQTHIQPFFQKLKTNVINGISGFRNSHSYIGLSALNQPDTPSINPMPKNNTELELIEQEFVLDTNADTVCGDGLQQQKKSKFFEHIVANNDKDLALLESGSISKSKSLSTKLEKFEPKLLGLPEKEHQILSKHSILDICTLLPEKHKYSNQKLLYSTYRDGRSLISFYRLAKNCGPSLLILLDDHDYKFGAYTSCDWHLSINHFGNGETFVFQVDPNLNAYRQKSSKSNEHNSYFCIGHKDFIGVGGGNNFAIYISKNFVDGCSGPCDTFNSPQLSFSHNFQIKAFEIQNFVSS